MMRFFTDDVVVARSARNAQPSPVEKNAESSQ